jgi:hypothetical protein
MNVRRKRVWAWAISLVLLYLVAPFFAGVLGASDPRGPKIFFEEHHYLLHSIGNGGQDKIPFMRERAWFYGLKGASMPQVGDSRGEANR